MAQGIPDLTAQLRAASAQLHDGMVELESALPPFDQKDVELRAVTAIGRRSLALLMVLVRHDLHVIIAHMLCWRARALAAEQKIAALEGDLKLAAKVRYYKSGDDPSAS